MKYIAEYKKYVSTIGDPLEKLDDIETYMDALESSFDQIDGKHEMGLISNKEYKIQVKERGSFFKWCNEEMTSIKDQYSDLIDERSKKGWSGHKRLTFPVVWNRGSYNKIEPEIRIAPVLSATIHPDLKKTLVSMSERTGLSISQVTDEVLYAGLIEMQEL